MQDSLVPKVVIGFVFTNDSPCALGETITTMSWVEKDYELTSIEKLQPQIGSSISSR